MKKLITKTVIRLILIATLVTILSCLTQSPIIGNHIALGQMQNTDEGFILMDLYNKLKPVVQAISIALGIYLLAGVVKDIYKYVKVQIENKKENTNNEEDI